MPSLIPSYVYSLFAALIVGSIVVYTCSLSTLNIQNQAEEQRLANITEYVALESMTLLSHSPEDDWNMTAFLDMPYQIGNQRYWIQIRKDSSNVWIESGFGTTIGSGYSRVCLPANVEASGSFLSGLGRAVLQCQSENQVVTLTLTSE